MKPDSGAGHVTWELRQGSQRVVPAAARGAR